MIIGISGYTGSGKSVLANFLSEKLKAKIVDADKIARKLMIEDNDLIQEINKTFAVADSGKIDFVKLGNIVFESAKNLKNLNTITFPYIIPAINSQLTGNDLTLLDAPLLPLILPEKICDFAVWVESDKNLRANRLKNRTNLDLDIIKNRIEKQMELMPEPQKSDFWEIIQNDSSIENLFNATVKIQSRLCRYF
jgi:dephospho-CoA kinase